MEKIAFLDRDGVIIYDYGYMHEPEKIKILPNAVKGLKELEKMGYSLVIITNQAGVARGYFSKETANDFHNIMLKMLKEQGVNITRTYFCFHHPDDNCNCRKPKIGMFEQVKADFKVNVAKSIMIGDKDGDIMFGNNCGLTTFLVKGDRYTCSVPAKYEVNNLLEVAKILSGFSDNPDIQI